MIVALLWLLGVFTKAPESAVDLEGFSRYTSSWAGYSILIPKGWTMNDSRADMPADIIRNPEKSVFLSVQTFDDDRFKQEGGFTLVFKQVEKEFSSNPDYTVEVLEAVPEHEIAGVTGPVGGFVVAGSYKEGEQVWRFKEYGIFTKSGRAFDLHGIIKKDQAKTYGAIVDAMLNSFKFEPISSAPASSTK